MSQPKMTLAARRAALIAQCAAQRAQVASDLTLLKSPASLGGATGFLARNRTMLLGAAGVGLGLLATRPRWLIGGATAAVSLYKMARQVLPMLANRQRD